MLGLGQLSPYSIDVHDPLRGVVVPQNLGVDLAELLHLVLRELFPGNKRLVLIVELVIRILVPLDVGQVCC